MMQNENDESVFVKINLSYFSYCYLFCRPIWSALLVVISYLFALLLFINSSFS